MLYNQITSTRIYAENELNWNGNDKCYISDDGDKYAFCFAPKSLDDGMINSAGQKELKRTLLYIKPQNGDKQRKIGPDFLEQPGFRMTIPYGHYGIIISSRVNFELHYSTVYGIYHGGKDEPSFEMTNNGAVLKDGAYYASVITDGNLKRTDNGIYVETNGESNTVISYGPSRDFAEEKSYRIFNNLDCVKSDSISFWENYFESCPVVKGIGNEVTLRQYWHWWCALINVSNIEFNDFPIYMSPDRGACWYGTWSNDGPETMAALSLTNQKHLVKKLIVGYIEAAINDDGIHSWYLHSDGKGCYGKAGDVGRLSQGVPNIIHTLDFYIRNTGDKSILEEKANNITIYEKVKKYFYKLFEVRDLDCDGLIEWRNLWETGWDNKAGCFFKKAGIDKWMEMSAEFDDEQTKAFYKENSYPVVAVVEQVYLRWAIKSMERLANLQEDSSTVAYCEKVYSLNLESFEEKCWNEEDGFYYDYNIRENCQIRAKSADCFYALYFEKNPERTERIIQKLSDKKAFGSVCIPMQSMDCVGFSPTGYWNGGHWPREMSYLSMGLNMAGKKELAKTTVIKAIMSGKDDYLYEVLDSSNGKPSTRITKMAYDVLEVVALLCIEGKIKW